MRANHHSLKILALASAALLASCAKPPPPKAPAPVPPAPAMPARPPAPTDWRDVPATPGDWIWSMEGGRSVARFAGGLLVLSCDTGARTVTMFRQGSTNSTHGQVPLTILASDISRPVTGTPVAGPPAAIAATFTADDTILDAMAFSRGRFAVETSGLPTLFVPSWPEVSRVIEDCR